MKQTNSNSYLNECIWSFGAGLHICTFVQPKPVSQLCEGFYGPAHLAQPDFVLRPLLDIWQFVEASWKEMLKTKSPVVGLISFLRVQGHTETGWPCVPLEEALAALLIPQPAVWAASRKPLPLLVQNREVLKYFKKISQLGTQLATAANSQRVSLPQQWSSACRDEKCQHTPTEAG